MQPACGSCMGAEHIRHAAVLASGCSLPKRCAGCQITRHTIQASRSRTGAEPFAPFACSNPPGEKLDAFAIIKSPLTTESAMKKIEDNNTLVRRPACFASCKCARQQCCAFDGDTCSAPGCRSTDLCWDGEAYSSGDKSSLVSAAPVAGGAGLHHRRAGNKEADQERGSPAV